MSIREFQGNPEQVTAEARREPVMIAQQGGEDLVLLSAAEFRRLKAKETVALRIAELPAERVRAMLDADLEHLEGDPGEDAAWRF